MATTDEILDAAAKIGKLVASHETATNLESAVTALQKDVESQRLLNDFNRHINALSEKEATGQPIEVEDKRRLEQLQSTLATNLTLRRFQMAQMDYLDLRRKIDEAVDNELAPAAATSSPSGGSSGGQAGASPITAP